MKLVDFIISNNRHHVAMVLPVVERLTKRPGVRCRLISLCEFRGLPSPSGAFRGTGVDFVRVLKRSPRLSPSLGRQGTDGRPAAWRRLARDLSWRFLLRGPLAALAADEPNLVVVPNDAAFPYDRIARLLDRRRIPFLLLQEGIRFPIPALPIEEDYGKGGARAFAAWGEASADYFATRGVPADRIRVTGSPRFDSLPRFDREAAAAEVRSTWQLPAKLLLLLTNPIDDQGFCSTRQKLALVARFAEQTAPLLAERGLHLTLKLHLRESEADYRRALGRLPELDYSFLRDAPLYPLFAASEAAVILASTVGLEALLFDLPLGVLEIPGHGYLYDYVQAGAATGLSWNAPLGPQLAALLDRAASPDHAAREYLERQLTTAAPAAEQVEALILELAG